MFENTPLERSQIICADTPDFAPLVFCTRTTETQYPLAIIIKIFMYEDEDFEGGAEAVLDLDIFLRINKK